MAALPGAFMSEPVAATVFGGSAGVAAADLALSQVSFGFRLMPCSMLGLLWLQTHFEREHWEPLAAGRVSVDPESCRQLCCDAESSGLRVSRLAI